MHTEPIKIFFSVGEPSGDLHGANLIRALHQQDGKLQFAGFGGPRMQAAGCELLEDLTQYAIMWFLRALLNVHKFYALLRRADVYFRDHRPDAVVLIDYPGFNWWIARKAQKHNIPVFYYGAPQMWAWAGWRVKKMRQLVDHVLCKLPFEKDWYGQRGCNAHYMGHPYFDQLQQQQPDRAFIDAQQRQPGSMVTILPGSRTQEVAHNLHEFLKVAAHIRARRPDVRFAIAAFKEQHAQMARDLIGQNDASLDVFVGRTAELIEAADCCLACSGSVSLELLYHTKPSVILYQVPRFSHFVATTFFMKVKYITLVNLLACDDRFDVSKGLYDPAAPDADRVPLPEYLTWEDRSQQMADHVLEWIGDGNAYRARVQQLSKLKVQLAHGGASNTAARYILETLRNADSDNSLQVFDAA